MADIAVHPSCDLLSQPNHLLLRIPRAVSFGEIKEASSSGTSSADMKLDLTHFSKNLKGILVSNVESKKVSQKKAKQITARQVSFDLCGAAENSEQMSPLCSTDFPDTENRDGQGKSCPSARDSQSSNEQSTDESAQGLGCEGVSSTGRNFEDIWESLESLDDDKKGGSRISHAASDLTWQSLRTELLGASPGTPKGERGNTKKLQKFFSL